ncbi:hypothetical protein BLOT_001670 [Blomia tropicalis]|nr:hypothetical protein BLOT_001670 [Blomia tropicalis]
MKAILAIVLVAALVAVAYGQMIYTSSYPMISGHYYGTPIYASSGYYHGVPIYSSAYTLLKK